MDASPYMRSTNDGRPPFDHQQPSWNLYPEATKVPLINQTGYDNLYQQQSTFEDDNRVAPRELKRWPKAKIFGLLADVLSICVAAAIFLYGVEVQRAATSGSPIDSDRARLLQRIAKTIPSFYSILFAKIVGSSLKSLALWRLEKGGRIGFFDSLLSSMTLGQAFTTHAQQISFLGLIIMLTWVFSPLGSQASLLVVGTDHHYSNQSTIVQYLNISSTAPATWGAQANQVPNHIIAQNETGVNVAAYSMYYALAPNSLFAASMMTPADTQTDGVDVWNNIKIPMIEHLSDIPSNSSGWKDVSSIANLTYSSLIGLPVSAISKAVNTTFAIETSYWKLDCPVLETRDEASDPTSYRAAIISDIDETNPSLYSNADRSQYSLLDNLPTNPVPRDIIYEGYDTEAITFANCTISSSFVEALVDCVEGTHCLVSKIRKSQLADNPPPEWTSLDTLLGKGFLVFGQGFVGAIMTSPVLRDEYCPYQGYLLNPAAAFSHETSGSVAAVGKEIFALRLAQLFNSYWIAMLAPNAVQKGLRNNAIQNDTENYFGASLQNATANTSTLQEVIACNKVWLIILLASSALLVVVGVCGLFFTFLRRAPTFDFTISTLVKDSPFVPGLHINSASQPDERVKADKDVMVRYGDVDPKGDSGYISIGRLRDAADGQHPASLKTSAGRLYR